MSGTKVSLWPIAPAYLSVAPFTNVMTDRKVLPGMDTLANLFGASVMNKKSLTTLTQE
jgi:hypothetical protein